MRRRIGYSAKSQWADIADLSRSASPLLPRKMLMKKENWPELTALTSIFSVELPRIEPVSGCRSLSQTCTELRNDIDCDSTKFTSVDTECAQNVPSRSLF
jgi:hypothetical protein